MFASISKWSNQRKDEDENVINNNETDITDNKHSSNFGGSIGGNSNKLFGRTNDARSLFSRSNCNTIPSSTNTSDNCLKTQHQGGEQKQLHIKLNDRAVRASLHNNKSRLKVLCLRFFVFIALIAMSPVSLLYLRRYSTKDELGGNLPKMNTPLLPSPRWTGRNAQPNQTVIFFHLYLGSPSKLNNQTMKNDFNSLSIVQEQLLQVGTSYAASSNDLHIYYNTVGGEMDSEWMYNLCKNKYNMTCTQLSHFPEGFEDKTLDALKLYCSEHPTMSVVYLHNKGSFHPKRSQNRWRRSVTAAATSKLCLKPDKEVSSCNVCGLMFQPVPGPHFPGNMWAAKCTYINNLHTMEDYHNRRLKLDKWIEEEQSKGTFHANLFPNERHYTGQGRYEAEQWIGSSPTLIPCDVSKTATLKYWMSGLNTFLGKHHPKDYTKEFKLKLAPRHSIYDDWIWYSYALVPDLIWMTDNKETNKLLGNLRLLDYFLLRGLIARWHIVYNQLPNTTISSTTDWIWSWFPDGDIWRSAVDTYGPDAINKVIANIPTPIVFNGTSYNESNHQQRAYRKKNPMRPR